MNWISSIFWLKNQSESENSSNRSDYHRIGRLAGQTINVLLSAMYRRLSVVRAMETANDKNIDTTIRSECVCIAIDVDLSLS